MQKLGIYWSRLTDYFNMFLLSRFFPQIVVSSYKHKYLLKDGGWGLRDASDSYKTLIPIPEHEYPMSVEKFKQKVLPFGTNTTNCIMILACAQPIRETGFTS